MNSTDSETVRLPRLFRPFAQCRQPCTPPCVGKLQCPSEKSSVVAWKLRGLLFRGCDRSTKDGGDGGTKEARKVHRKATILLYSGLLITVIRYHVQGTVISGSGC